MTVKSAKMWQEGVCPWRGPKPRCSVRGKSWMDGSGQGVMTMTVYTNEYCKILYYLHSVGLRYNL
jgi:hypothetical protein